MKDSRTLMMAAALTAVATVGSAAVTADDVWFFADFDSPAAVNGDVLDWEPAADACREGRFGRGFYFRRGSRNDLVPMRSFLADAGNFNFVSGAKPAFAPGRITLPGAGAFEVKPLPVKVRFSANRPWAGYAMSCYVKGAKGVKVTLSPALTAIDDRAVKAFRKKNPKFDEKTVRPDACTNAVFELTGEWQRVWTTPVVDPRVSEGRKVTLKIESTGPVELERFQYEHVACYPYHDVYSPTTWVDGGGVTKSTQIVVTDPEIIRSFPKDAGGWCCWYRREPDMPKVREYPVNFWGIGPIYFSAFKAYGVTLETDGYKSRAAPKKGGLPDDGEWHHVAGSWRGGELRVYVDGRCVATNSAPSLRDPADGRQPHFFVGGCCYGHEAGEAVLDEFAIFKRPLADDEVKALASAKAGLMTGSGKLFGGRVQFTGFFRNDPSSALRAKVVAPERGEWRIEATVGGRGVGDLGPVTFEKGVNELEIPFRAADFRPGHYEWSFRLADAAGATGLESRGTMRIFPRRERDAFHLMSWGGFAPGDFSRTMGFDTFINWSTDRLGIRNVLNAGEFANVRYENSEEWKAFDCDFAAIGRKAAAELARYRSVYGWWGTLVCSEVYGAWALDVAKNYPSYVKLAERDLGTKPVFAVAPSPARLDLKALGLKPFTGVIGPTNAALRTFEWFLDGHHPVVLSNGAVRDAVHALSPGNVVWTEPTWGGNMKTVDMFADWFYSHYADVTAMDVCQVAAAQRASGRPFQPTLTTWYTEGFGGAHPYLKDKAGRPLRVGVTQTADELKVKSWIAIAAARADNLSFWNAGQLLEGVKGADLLAAGSTNAVRFLADADAPRQYGEFYRSRLVPAAELFRGVVNVRGPVAYVRRGETGAVTGMGWGDWHYNRQLYRAIATRGVQVDCVCEEELTPENLAGYRALVVPQSGVVTERNRDALMAAAKRGATIVQDRDACVRYPDDLVITNLRYWVNKPQLTAAPLLDWFTNRVDEFRGAMAATSDCDGGEGFTFVKDYRGVRFVTVVNDRRSDDRSRLMTTVCTNAAYRPYGAPRTIVTTLNGVGAGAAVYEFNAAEGSSRRIEKASGRRTVTADYAAAEGRVFCVYPKALADPELSLEGAAKAGSTATLVVKIRDADGAPAPGRQIVRLALTDPKGAETDESGLYRVENGVARIPLRFPLDAEPGSFFARWKARVVDLTTGAGETLKFTLGE